MITDGLGLVFCYLEMHTIAKSKGTWHQQQKEKDGKGQLGAAGVGGGVTESSVAKGDGGER